MHEYSVAKRLFDLAMKVALEHGAERVLEVRISIGELSLVAKEQLEFWFKELSRGTLLEGAKLAFEVEGSEVLCPACGYRGPIQLEDKPEYHILLPTLRCPNCGGVVKVLKGRDCVLKHIRLVLRPVEKGEGGFRPPKGGPSASAPG